MLTQVLHVVNSDTYQSILFIQRKGVTIDVYFHSLEQTLFKVYVSGCNPNAMFTQVGLAADFLSGFCGKKILAYYYSISKEKNPRGN